MFKITRFHQAKKNRPTMHQWMSISNWWIEQYKAIWSVLIGRCEQTTTPVWTKAEIAIVFVRVLIAKYTFSARNRQRMYWQSELRVHPEALKDCSLLFHKQSLTKRKERKKCLPHPPTREPFWLQDDDIAFVRSRPRCPWTCSSVAELKVLYSGQLDYISILHN